VVCWDRLLLFRGNNSKVFKGMNVLGFMERDNELMNLKSEYSLVRGVFKGEVNFDGHLDLNNSPAIDVSVPEDFEDMSFVPNKGLKLPSVIERISKDLLESGADEAYLRKTIPGVGEAIKNAYEHGNNRKRDKKITLARAISEGNLEFVVGDEGGIIDSTFFPYILVFRECNRGEDSFYRDVDDFYKFKKELFAPEGHSGVGTRVMNICFEGVHYYKKKGGGLLVHLEKPFPFVKE
jgi:hypothetical protein